MKKKIRFIINPKSGASQKEHFEEWILSGIDESQYTADICFTEGPLHATILSREASDAGYDVVVAVGGDGSVNEVGNGIIGSSSALGILPTGSGNGMSRHLKIPLDFRKAVQTLNQNTIIRIDSMRINDKFCIGTFGVGFDAHIAHLFSKAPKRGYSTYVKLVLSEFQKYPANILYRIYFHPNRMNEF